MEQISYQTHAKSVTSSQRCHTQSVRSAVRNHRGTTNDAVKKEREKNRAKGDAKYVWLLQRSHMSVVDIVECHRLSTMGDVVLKIQ